MKVEGLNFGTFKSANGVLTWDVTVEDLKVNKDDLVDMTAGFKNFVEVCWFSLPKISIMVPLPSCGLILMTLQKANAKCIIQNVFSLPDDAGGKLHLSIENYILIISSISCVFSFSSSNFVETHCRYC